MVIPMDIEIMTMTGQLSSATGIRIERDKLRFPAGLTGRDGLNGHVVAAGYAVHLRGTLCLGLSFKVPK